MADYAIHDTTLTDIANKIRKKDGTSALIDPADYADRIDLMGMLKEKSASGAIANISDGADDVALKDLIFYASPVQASGTPSPSNPLPISGHTEMNGFHTGKNLIPNVTYQRNANTLRLGTDTLDGRIYIKAGTYTLQVTSDVSCTLHYTLNDGSTTAITTQSAGSVYYGAFNISEGGYIFFHAYRAGGITASNVSNIMLELGWTKTEYQAYSVESHKWTFPPFGKNLYNKDGQNVVEGYISTTTFSTGNRNAKTVYIPIKGNTTYTVSKTAGQRFQIATAEAIPADGVAYTSRVSQSGTQSSLSITSGANDTYLWAWVFLDGTDTGTLAEMLASVQIEESSSATAYEPYQEMYEGEVNALTGEVESEKKMVIFKGDASENWQFSLNSDGTKQRVWIYISDSESDSNDINGNIIVSDTAKSGYPDEWKGWINTSKSLVIGVPSSITSASDFKTFLASNNLQVCYLLADSVATTLDTVSWKSKLGVNNFYNDCGESEVDYRSSGTVYTYPAGEGVSF